MKLHVVKTAHPLVALCLVALVESLASAFDTPPPALPIVSSSLPERMEMKLVVPADKVAAATKMLKLDEQTAVKEVVVFFDTEDCVLAAKNLILRARQKAGNLGDSTVKLRTSESAYELTKAEKSIRPEADWLDEAAPVISRSIDNESLSNGSLRQVIEGRAAAVRLFNRKQRRLVEGHVKDFNWGGLKCYGPILTEVWSQQFKLKGFSDSVTVERWHLKKVDRTLDILEVSSQARTQTDAEAKALVQQFYKATEEAGLGRPGGRSKTQIVLDFFKPGPHPESEAASPNGN